MATKVIGGDANVTFEIDYDAALRITALRCINNTDQAAYGSATMLSNGRTYGTRFAPGTTYIPVPTTSAQRLQLVLDERGRLDGVEYHFVWPYP